MASFYLDENVSERLTLPLESLGHSATSAGQLGHKGRHDGFQLLFAASNDHVLITHNIEDFKLLHRSWLDWSNAWNVTDLAIHQGILLLYPSRGVVASDLAAEIHRFICTAGVIANRMHTWSLAAGWNEAF